MPTVSPALILRLTSSQAVKNLLLLAGNFLVIFFTKQIGGEYLFFVSWFMSVVLLLQGWIQSYIGYLIGLMTFFVIKIIFENSRRKNDKINR